MKDTKTMRKLWDPIPKGICSLPIVCRKELAEHFENIQKRELKILQCEVFTRPAWKNAHMGRRRMRKLNIRRAIEQIEDESIVQGLRLTDNVITISRIKGGFIIWAIGYPMRMHGKPRCFAPLKATHPIITEGLRCPVCKDPFRIGDVVTLCSVQAHGEGGIKDRVVQSIPVHRDCYWPKGR